MTLSTDQDSGARPVSGVAAALEGIRELVLAHWVSSVRRNIRGARSLRAPILINTLPSFYANVVQALTPGYPRDDATDHSTAATAHAGERARMTDYGAEQLIHEYQLFQDAIREVSAAQGIAISADEWLIIEQSVNAAIREAVRAFTAVHEELRRKVAAALSHDMRTPLAVIANGAQLIEVAEDLAQARRLGEKIAASAHRLDTMVGEVLDALTTHDGARLPLRLSRFDMRDLIVQVQREFADRYPAALEVDSPSITGWWCRETLRRALENLVSNAIKYGDGGPIRIALAEAHGNIVLTVHNTGNPLDEDQRCRIFDYLRRERKVQAQGWGIGLPFVKQAAENHGGSVAVDSSAATGTTFLIDVPVDCRPYLDPGSRAAPQDAPALPAAGPLTVPG